MQKIIMSEVSNVKLGVQHILERIDKAYLVKKSIVSNI